MLRTFSLLIVGIVALAVSTLSAAAAIVPPAPSAAPRRALSLRDALLHRRQNLPHLPDCVAACIEQSAESVGCNEYNCLCHSASFINSTAFCFAATCSDAAAAYGVEFGREACLAIGVTESIPDAANSVLAAKTTAGTSGAFDAAPTTASAVTAASVGASPSSGPATPSPSSSPSNSGSWRLTPGVDAFGGAAVAALAFGLALLL